MNGAYRPRFVLVHERMRAPCQRRIPALVWLEVIGWRIAHGPDIAPDMPAAERRDYGEVALAQRLRDALARPIRLGRPAN